MFLEEMKVFLDSCLCVIMFCLLVSALGQVLKLCQERLTVIGTMSKVTGQTGVNLAYQHHLVILVTELVLFVILREVVFQ